MLVWLFFIWCFCINADEVVIDPTNPTQSKKLSFVDPFFVNLTSYSGFFKVHDQEQAHLFFWFFECKNDIQNTPLIVWLQGQPGLSSLFGLYDEHGPLYLETKTFEIKIRKHAWTSKYNVLYLDPHVDCGFSYANTNRPNITVEEISFRLLTALQQFFVVFSEYRARDVYLAGAFDASKFISIISHINLGKEDPNIRINLRGLIIGGGFTFDGIRPRYEDDLYATGFLHLNEKDYMQRYLTLIDVYLRAKQLNKTINAFGEVVEKKVRQMGFDTLFDARDTNPLQYSLAPIIAQRQWFKNLVHVGDRIFKNETRFVSCYTFVSVRYLVPKLLRYYKILLYNGQFDLLTPYSSTSSFIENLHWDGNSDYYDTERHHWKVDGKFLGYWTSAYNLTHVFVRNAGHLVGFTQPDAMYHMLDYFVEGKFK